MNGFLKVTVGGTRHILNVAHIVMVQESCNAGRCIITFKPGGPNVEDVALTVDVDIDEIEQMIATAVGRA